MRRQAAHAARHARALTRALTARLNLVGTNAWLALTVELLTGPGETQVLRAAGARRYLADVAFDTAPLERAYQRHYAPRPPGGG